MEAATVQRRTLRLLFVTQIISGIGVAVGASVGALLAADIAGVAVSSLAQSAVVVGAALFALPATAIVDRHGRRPSLAAGYFVAAVGSLIVVAAAARGPWGLQRRISRKMYVACLQDAQRAFSRQKGPNRSS